jgi:transposase InsO family protein
MRQKGLIGRCRRRSTRMTLSDPETKAATYIWTWEGWLYLAMVIDLSSRRVVGWSMADHMRTELVADALRMAIAARRPAPRLIFHSDR